MKNTEVLETPEILWVRPRLGYCPETDSLHWLAGVHPGLAVAEYIRADIVQERERRLIGIAEKMAAALEAASVKLPYDDTVTSNMARQQVDEALAEWNKFKEGEK